MKANKTYSFKTALPPEALQRILAERASARKIEVRFRKNTLVVRKLVSWGRKRVGLLKTMQAPFYAKVYFQDGSSVVQGRFDLPLAVRIAVLILAACCVAGSIISYGSTRDPVYLFACLIALVFPFIFGKLGMWLHKARFSNNIPEVLEFIQSVADEFPTS